MVVPGAAAAASAASASPAAAAATTTAEERAEAAAMRSGGSGAARAGSAAVARCSLEEGIQKYVVVEAAGLHYVSGVCAADYHKDAARPLLDKLNAAGLSYTVLGGGRITVDSASRTVQIYGYSYGFPWANGVFRHDLAAKVVEQAYEGWDVKTSDEGY
mmetsp:Transcript_2472/g.9004  ORF Transcript_2472/g.9004 Transcript_2472/m.9004 type:complete len:159 (+) Transcript_2472:1-477(+)